MANEIMDIEMNTSPETDISVDLDPAAMNNWEAEELSETVSDINNERSIESETEEKETNSKWTKEDMEFASTKHEFLSPEALDNAVSYGLPFTLFGFSVVFAILAIIMSIVIVFGKIFGVAQPKQKQVEKKQEPKKQQVEKQQNSGVEEAPVAASPVADDKGIVAAIIAAISSFRSANGENGGFRVVSFKKRK